MVPEENGHYFKDCLCKVADFKAPEITINGDLEVTLFVGDKYVDKGATATDDCAAIVDIKTTSDVNTDKAGNYRVTYKASDFSGNESSVSRSVEVKDKEGEKKAEEKKTTKKQTNTTPTTNVKGAKIIYLTFDDGPGAHTSRLLDVLKKYDVKATFFVTCNGGSYTNMIKREYDEGHTVALHTCNHNYASVYANDDAYFNDLNNISNLVKEQTGGFEPKLVRFPGGSSNTVSRKYNRGIMSRLAKALVEKGYAYFDWNVSSGDAGGANNANAVYNNVVKSLKGDYSVVLQHDIKGFSVDAVERIIQYGLDNGFTFRTLDSSSPGAHHRINN